MSNFLRGLSLAVVQVALIASVGANLLYQRATLPRAWIETTGVDPELPIRGRYVSLGLLLPGARDYGPRDERACGRIEMRAEQPVAVIEDGCEAARTTGRSVWFTRRQTPQGERWLVLQPVAYFLPEHARDPTSKARPGELWVEATLPKRAAPRPIRLGRMRDGRIEPID